MQKNLQVVHGRGSQYHKPSIKLKNQPKPKTISMDKLHCAHCNMCYTCYIHVW